ncbi:hypothetical protein LSUB1_G007462 [Lachnellula subtilissima]|uniref:Extracellular membrane protein CFEM domain-containing protein n=1 Tax=Lachnellula subtilissima TaxID=602034 RepID=A0A8H8U8D8_9HELO|nr:hypothetical protein LSUB1_G007462 [Lachnellula subtilissima]
MLFYQILLYVFIPVVAGSANISPSQCSIDCISTELGTSPLLLSNINSTCKNSTLQASILACVYAKCNSTEQWSATIVHNQLCGTVRIESRVWPLAIAGIVCVSLSLLAVVLRCCSRYAVALKFGYDDLTIIVAAVFLIALVVLDLYSRSTFLNWQRKANRFPDGFINGFGRHFWNIDPIKVAQLLKIFYPSSSHLSDFLVANIFRIRFEVITLTTMAAVLLSGLAVMFALIFQCTPVSGVWDKSIASKCVNLNLLAYTAGGIAVALDVVILILPIPKCIELHVNIRKKLGVSFIFVLGGV